VLLHPTIRRSVVLTGKPRDPQSELATGHAIHVEVEPRGLMIPTAKILLTLDLKTIVGVAELLDSAN
jgi:hypothetical protein